MAKITPIGIGEQFEPFLKDLKESFWGDLYGKTRLAWKQFWDAQCLRERDRYMKAGGMTVWNRVCGPITGTAFTNGIL
jgi:hypothetical protein